MLLTSLVGCLLVDPPQEPPQPTTVTPKREIGVIGATPPKAGDPEVAITTANCNDVQDGGPLAGPGCVTAKVSCGDVVIGHTKGGSASYDTKFYEANQCTPATTDHDGGDERVYLLELPAGEHHADIWLDSPCADLDLAGMLLQPDAEVCGGDALQRCEMRRRAKGVRESVRLVAQGAATRWLLVVEGEGQAEGPFSMTIQCSEGLY